MKNSLPTLVFSIFLSGASLVATHSAIARVDSDLKWAPPAFGTPGKYRAVYVDFQNVDVQMVFDVKNKTVKAIAQIYFLSGEQGFPIIDLRQPLEIESGISRVTLNGTEVNPLNFFETYTPDHETKTRIIWSKVEANAKNVLTIEYIPYSLDAVFDSQGVSALFWLVDAYDRTFMERYIPSSFEYDAFQLRLSLKVNGASPAQRLYTNGQTKRGRSGEWQILFPSFYTVSSPLIHLTTKQFNEIHGTYQSITGRTFPILIYGPDPSANRKTLPVVLNALKENEKILGPYMHSSLLIFTADQPGGIAGMEYCGGMVIAGFDQRTIEHELTHSWFARGVMPMNGNSGWMDEAIVSWHDLGYPVEPLSLDHPVDLAGHSPYMRKFFYALGQSPYEEGAQFISGLAYLSSKAGKDLKEIMKQFYLQKAGSRINTDMLQDYLQKSTSLDLSREFARFIYGQNIVVRGLVPNHSHQRYFKEKLGFHPRPLTSDLVKRIQ